ncbi:MAG TPA: YggS family pyridoxal phosphate-dependent enzyme, partial [Clostridiales bacterium]|nr:YggS family pyridoxal phosphate-dependent enzyme [Clostridiales bacterium]
METDFEEQLKTDIALRLNNVTESINRACKEAGRDASEVTLVGVSKVFPVGYAEAAFLSGLKDLGENRVQELLPKEERMGELGL